MVFGLDIAPFLEIISWPTDKSGRSNKIKHTCSMSADVIREEVGLLKDDFNYRLKQLMFNSLLSAYYTSFIPCCFAQVSCVFILFYFHDWFTSSAGHET